MDPQDTTRIRTALDALHSDFENGRNLLLTVTLSRLQQLIRQQRRNYPRLVGQSDNTESLVLEKLNRALEAGHRPQTALHFWNLSAKITRQVLIDLTRVNRPELTPLTAEVIESSSIQMSSSHDSHDPSTLAELTELHQLIENVRARLSEVDSQILCLRFYTELSFNEIAELLELTIDTVRYHWRSIRLELATAWNQEATERNLPSLM